MIEMRRNKNKKARIIHSWNGEKVRIEDRFLLHFIRHGFAEYNDKLHKVFFTNKEGFFQELNRVQNSYN